jgi:hypothetical protein
LPDSALLNGAPERRRNDAGLARERIVEVGLAPRVQVLRARRQAAGDQLAAGIERNQVEEFGADGLARIEVILQPGGVETDRGGHFGREGRHVLLPGGQAVIDEGGGGRQQGVLLVADHAFHVALGQRQRHQHHQHGRRQHQQRHHAGHARLQR